LTKNTIVIQGLHPDQDNDTEIFNLIFNS